MPQPIPVPGRYNFPRVAVSAWAENEDQQIVTPPMAHDFPFWKYVGLSVTAGLITHYLIRFLGGRK